MPEGDAVWRTARRLHARLAGHEIVEWDLRWPRWATTDLRGSRTTEVVARGKHLLHRLDSGHTLHTHLRMEGSWRVLEKAGTRPRITYRRDVRALIGTTAHWAVGLALGEVDLVRSSDEVRLVGHLGPDPLGHDWSPAQAAVRLQEQGERAVGEALLDQTVISGLGTIWVSEVLWAERLHPATLVGALGDDDLARVADRSAVLLTAAATSPRRPILRVYDRTRWPCPRCGGRVTTVQVGRPPRERRLFACTGCQTAD